MWVRSQPGSRQPLQGFRGKAVVRALFTAERAGRTRACRGADVPGTRCGGRPLPPWKGQGRKWRYQIVVRARAGCNGGRGVARQKLRPKNQLGARAPTAGPFPRQSLAGGLGSKSLMMLWIQVSLSGRRRSEESRKECGAARRAQPVRQPAQHSAQVGVQGAQGTCAALA